MIDRAAEWLSNHPAVSALVLVGIVLVVIGMGWLAMRISIRVDDDDQFGC